MNAQSIGRYIHSVPLLQREWRVRGYVWDAPADLRGTLPADVTYIGALPPERILLATPAPTAPSSDCIAWPLTTTNPPAKTGDHPSPFATVDDRGQYTHLESFSLPIDSDEPPPGVPVFCTFLCAATQGIERLCDD
jgi:hypothetical protein